jgi:hypothetical protein
LRKVRELRNTITGYAATIKASIEMIRSLQIENTSLRDRNLALIDENRALLAQLRPCDTTRAA